jgi:ABC-type proline/glycine betaine transport system permease subunit
MSFLLETDGLWGFFMSRKTEIIKLLLEHIELTIIAVVVAIIIGVPLGILITKVKKLSKPVMGITNVVQAVPSLALLGFLVPSLGIGSKPAIVMVVLYSLLPIVKNTYIGLINIDRDILEAADGMGMTKNQTLFTAVGLMTIAAFIGAGGLGSMVFSGVQTVNNNMILAGAIPACILALLIDFGIGKFEKLVVPKGLNK